MRHPLPRASVTDPVSTPRVALALATAALSWAVLHAFPLSAAPRTRASGAAAIVRTELACRVGASELRFEELRWTPGSGTELAALANRAAAPNPRCRNGYGGPDLPALLATLPDSARVLAGTNGTFFRVSGRGYASNHLVWSKASGLIAPFRKAGGASLFLADARGGHELRIRFESCGKGSTCARLDRPYPPELASPAARARFARLPDSPAWIAALREAYPSMTFAIQSHMRLVGGREGSLQCPTDENGAPRYGDWRCARAPRTALCGREDGSVSLFTTSGAAPHELSEALKKRGACHAECVHLHNLDGGGSTQSGYRQDQEWIMNGNRMETSEPGCSPFRPVDHYIVFLSSRAPVRPAP